MSSFSGNAYREGLAKKGSSLFREATTNTNFVGGNKIEANYEGDGDYYPGKISQVNANGTCDISYDDGDSELNVRANLIRKKGGPASKKTAKYESRDHKLNVEPQPLLGSNRFCVFGQHFLATEHPNCLTMVHKQNDLDKNDYTVYDDRTRAPVFEYNGKKATMLNTRGMPIFVLKSAGFISNNWVVVNPVSGKTIYTVKNSLMSSRFNVEVTTADGKDVVVYGKQSTMRTFFALWLGDPEKNGHPIACSIAPTTGTAVMEEVGKIGFDASKSKTMNCEFFSI